MIYVGNRIKILGLGFLNKMKKYLVSPLFFAFLAFVLSCSMSTASEPLPYSHYTGMAYNDADTTFISLDFGRANYIYPGTFFDARAAKVFELDGKIEAGSTCRFQCQSETRRPGGWWEMEIDTTSQALKGIRYNSFAQITEAFILAPEFEYALSDITTERYSWHTRYPKIPCNTSSWKKVKEISQNLFSADSAEFFKSLADYTSMWSKDDSFPSFPFYYDVDTRIASLSGDFISLVEIRYQYTGGAHGMTNYKTYTAEVSDKKNGTINLRDLFIPGSPWQTVLSSLVWKEVYDRGGQQPYWDLTEKIPLKYLDNFTLSDAGLTLYFDPYILGCYAEGPYVVTIPLTVLGGTLNPKGPAARFLGVNRGK